MGREVMEKRYQVFVSSTHDLVAERQAVMRSLLELGCIPAGLEPFPVSDDDEWALITRVIDDCDYYIAIVGTRYGSIGPGGKSYAQMECEYAISRKKPVIAFLYSESAGHPGVGAEELSTQERGLREFRGLVGRQNCQKYKSIDDLRVSVVKNLSRFIAEHPAVGWIRPGNPDPHDLAAEYTKQSGLVDAFRLKPDSRKWRLRIAELISEESSSKAPYFRLAARSGSSYFSPSGTVYGEGLARAIERGAKVEAVVESPFTNLAAESGRSSITDQRYAAINDLRALERSRLHVSVNVTDIALNCSLFFTRHSVLFRPYLLSSTEPTGSTEHNFWVIEFRKVEEGDFECYGILEKHFEALRQNSVPLSEFLFLHGLREDRDAAMLRARQYGELVDKKFTSGLTRTEEEELQHLSKLLDEEDESFYGPLRQRLLAERNDLLKKKGDKRGQER
jgi:hypothetical protein